MNIVAVDPHARALSRDEVLALLEEPLVLRLGMVDEGGWPLVHPVWHVFDGGVFRLLVGRTADVCRKELLKYTGTDKGPFAEDMLKWAVSGDMSVVELTPVRFGTFQY